MSAVPQNDETEVDAATGDDNEFELAQVANLLADEVPEIRYEMLPKGMYMWEFLGHELDEEMREIDGEEKKQLIIRLKFKVVDVIQLIGVGSEAPQPDQILNREHTERFNFGDPAEVLGRAKGFAIDAGFWMGGPGQTYAGALIAGVGARFTAPYGHRRDKNDRDKFYGYIVQDKKKMKKA